MLTQQLLNARKVAVDLFASIEAKGAFWLFTIDAGQSLRLS